MGRGGKNEWGAVPNSKGWTYLWGKHVDSRRRSVQNGETYAWRRELGKKERSKTTEKHNASTLKSPLER